MSDRRVVGLGAGGHAAVMIEILRLAGGFELAGLLDPRPELWQTRILGTTVIGDDSRLAELHRDGIHWAFIGVGSVGDMTPRRRLHALAIDSGFDLVNAIHPRAIVSPAADVGRGVAVMAGACVNAGARLGDSVIVNTGAIVEHHGRIGSHVHIATGARLGGDVTVGDGTHVGIGATVLQGVRIGCRVIVGAGAVVTRDVADGVVVAGVPARVIRRSGDA